MDPLSHYASHAFIPHLPTAPKSSVRPETSMTTPLKLHKSSAWTYSGPILSAAPSSLPPSFHAWASATLSSPSELLDRLLPFLSFLQTFLKEAGVAHYWLTVRATKPTQEYDIPRWHVDDEFFSQPPGSNTTLGGSKSGKRSWKLATTLLGPSTLFLHDNETALTTLCQTKQSYLAQFDHTCTSIRCLGCSTYADAVRQSLATSLSTHTTTSPAYGQVAFFRLGDEEGAVHSEPKCDEDRIFVNVIPGTEVELRELMGRWGMGFPRAWCFGVLVGFVRSDESVDLLRRGNGEGLKGDEEVEAESDKEGKRFKRKCIMSVNMGTDYGTWLDRKDFTFTNMFGHAWDSTVT